MASRKITPATQEALKLDQKARARYALEDRWIPYQAGAAILDELQFTLTRPRGNRPQGMAVIGDSNNGKTEVLKQFITKNQTERFDDRVNVRILNIEAPPVPNLGQLYTKILGRIGDPKAESGTVNLRLERLLILLSRLEVECLVIDEIHNVLAGSPAQQKAFLNMLKHISNELKVPVIISGTEAVEHVISTDFQVQSRYPIFRLPRWFPDNELATLLVRLEATLPLKHTSHIWDYTHELHEISGGVIGNIISTVKRSAYEVILSGAEKITLNDLKLYSENIAKPYDSTY